MENNTTTIDKILQDLLSLQQDHIQNAQTAEDICEREWSYGVADGINVSMDIIKSGQGGSKNIEEKAE